MAHLIKLEDYVSRYETDIQRYPSQFTRLKKERWHHLKREWLQANVERKNREDDGDIENWFENTGGNFFTSALEKLKQIPWKKKQKHEDWEEDSSFLSLKGKELDEVKDMYFADLYEAQLRWASSSLLEESRLHPKYKYDLRLRQLLRELPDNYMLLYYPVFVIGKAPVEMDIILISPTDMYLMVMLEGQPDTIFEPATDKYWYETEQERKKILSPLLSLNRMTGMMREILKRSDISYPMHRVVISPDSFIDYLPTLGKTELIDKRTYRDWLEKRRRHPSPIKKAQIEFADVLLQHTLTTSFKRYDIFDEKKAED